MTLIVLGLDALDAALVEYFDLPAFELNRHGEMETFANMKDDPYTPEVWASVATGLEPAEHGVTDEGTSEWDNPLLQAASRFTGTLPQGTRAKLGDFVESVGAGEFTIGRTGSPSMFDGEGRVVHTWPGVASGENVVAMWKLMRENNVSDVPLGEFRRRAYGTGVQQVAWAREMLDHDLVLAGAHVHTLDVCGHAFATDEPLLRQVYEKVATWVEALRGDLGEDDDLLILSDHGMRTSFYDDDRTGSHSFRAFASTTIDVAPPDSVFEVSEWVEQHVDAPDGGDHREVDLPTETLQDLGYIE